MEWKTNETIPQTFFNIAQQVYVDDPLWISESPTAIAQQFSENNDYFSANNANKVWLKVQNGTRLVGFFNPRVIIDENPVAFFGFWESMNTFEDNRDLFQQFEHWAQAQGSTAIYGPINFSTNFGNYRVRLNRFEKGCFLGEPYNPPYYVDILKQLGYQCKHRYKSDISYDLQSVIDDNKTLIKNLHENLDKRFQFVPLTRELWYDKLPDIYRCLDNSFHSNFAYTSFGYDAFETYYRDSVGKRIFEDASLAVFDRQSQMIGCLITFPDYSPLVHQGADQPIAIADLDYRLHYPKIPKPALGLIKTVGVRPKYRRLGHLFVAMVVDVFQNLLQAGCCQGSGATYKEGNRSGISGNYADETREYGLFFKDLNMQP